jgi:signal transduction histidine kinase
MHHIMKALDRSLHHPLAERQIDFTIDYDAIPTQATFADADRLHQVLHKVAMNAIKYTPDGGRITVTGRERPGFIEILIQDTGIGISPDNINQIFDAFSSSGDVSLHSSGKVKFKGSGPGLGLPIARGIIEEHGGSIWVESPGYDEQTYPGSTFHIMIPMREEPPDEPLSEANHQHQPQQEE